MRTDFIQLLMDSELKDHESSGQTSNKLDSDEITAQGISFLLAAFDTTSSALSHVVYYLSQNKDCEQRLYEELKDVKDFSFENLSRLKYLNAVIDETLRISPPPNRIQRQSIKDFQLSNGKNTINFKALFSTSIKNLSRHQNTSWHMCGSLSACTTQRS